MTEVGFKVFFNPSRDVEPVAGVLLLKPFLLATALLGFQFPQPEMGAPVGGKY